MKQTTDRGSLGVLEQAKVFQGIKARLRRELGHRWPAGERMPPIKDLARLLGAGQTNTHRAVKELVRDGLLVSRPGHGTFVTHRATPQALFDDATTAGGSDGALAGRTIRILLAAAEPDTFLRRAVTVFADTLAMQGARIDRTVYRQNDAEALAQHQDVDGVFVVNPNAVHRLAVAAGQSLAIFSTSHDLQLPMTGGYDMVSVDSEQGGRLAGRHLAPWAGQGACFMGCHPPGLTDRYDRTSEARLHGFEQGLGAPVPADHRLIRGHYSSLDGAKLVAEYLQLKPRPHCVFAASDELAIGFVHGAMAHGLNPGRDYAIVGFDGQQRGRDLQTGALTSVEIPSHAMGQLAAVLLANRLLNPDRPTHTVQLGCSFFVGKTTHAAPPVGAG